MARRPRARRTFSLRASLSPMGDTVRAVVAAAHRTVRGVIELACREAGVTVTERVETAVAATQACRSTKPELLVLDLELPDADGFRVLADLADDLPPSVLVLADRADGDYVLRALRLGARGYVTKAEGLRDLADSIRRVVAGERVMTPTLEKDAIGALGRMARRAREGADLEAGLTPRERQVLDLLSGGFTIGQIASRLGISPRTVETHVAKVYRKLGVRTRVQAISRAATLGLIDL
jgi:DNA-binding NarL/FixJ family response regulator